ncbi:HAD family hydrolase [bacterium]
MNQANFQAAIFDLDGVIVNTVPIHFRAWEKMFTEYGIPFTFNDYKQKVDGIPRIDGTKAILTNLSEEDILKASHKKQKYFLEFLHEEPIPVFHSTVEFIKELKSNNIHTAIISSSKNCHYILDKAGLLDLFEAEITGNDITIGKPDPQIFLMAAEQLKIDPTNCVVFEDAVLGVEAGKKANMKCVGIDRHQDPERLNKAEIIINDLSEINFEQVQQLFS